MTFLDFQKQANQWGKQGVPFLFIIDFDLQKPKIFLLSELATQGVYFDIQGTTNWQHTIPLPVEPFSFQTYPMSLNSYQVGFEHVKQQLQLGNSYLLNLTYATAIQTNYSLKQLFQCTEAPYKLLVENDFMCFSPECFVRIHDNKIYTYPMKGTIDAHIPDGEKQLLESRKEQWEHNTIVDLLRNDLAMVAENIAVTRFRYVEKVNTAKGAILQTSSEICGELPLNWATHIGDILAKLLPAGSISGAPKEKTLSIIHQIEPESRHYYTGVFGVFDGVNLQSAVMIRYLEQQGEKMVFRSGGGITTQSRLQEEYHELIQKVYVPLKKA